MSSQTVKTITNDLRKAGRPQFASILEKYWHIPLQEYAKSLYVDQPSAPLEFELLRAFETEFHRMGYSSEECLSILASIQRTRVLQTATHVTASEGPTFFAIHQLALAGIPTEETYIVAAFSGVPFSNSAWSGCLNYSMRYAVDALLLPESPWYTQTLKAATDRAVDTDEARISLIPGTMRDQRVYRAEIPTKAQEIFRFLTPPLQKCIPAWQGKDYTQFALRFCQRQMQSLFPEKHIIFIDINEVITHYLQNILFNPLHPISQLFFNAATQQEVLGVVRKDLSLFTVPYQHKKGWRQEPVRIHLGALESDHGRWALEPKILIDALERGQLCPGLFLTFIILSFLNGLKCLGSFEQVEYLASYQSCLRQIGWIDQDLVNQANVLGLTTGRCFDEKGMAIFPLDAILGTSWHFSGSQPFGEWLMPFLPRLLKSFGTK